MAKKRLSQTEDTTSTTEFHALKYKESLLIKKLN